MIFRLLPPRAAPALLPLFACAAPIGAQQLSPPELASRDTVTVVANADYGGGPLRRSLLGNDYRELWAAPIRVPVLDLDRFTGGLEVRRRAGRKQTVGLRFRGGDGREYVFRSVDKDPLLARSPALEETFAGWLVRDQTSALMPAGALMLPPLLEAAGVIHVVPHLVVMPDHPRLGEHREEFAGMLGLIEERPDEGDDEFVVAGSTHVIGSERLRERLLEGPRDRVDSRALLTARLVDALVNDRDRHWGQWRWARFDHGRTRYWRPIPEDRDYAFVDFDGLVPSAARRAIPHMIPFGRDYPDVAALNYNSFDLDRRLLSDLPREVWDSIAVEVQTRVGDDVIARAVGRLPEPYRDRMGSELARDLEVRRDALPRFAREWYAWLSTEVDVHGTDGAELARADYRPDGAVEVRLYALDDGEPAGEAFFQRLFVPSETREVRMYLHGGDDRAVVRGDPEGDPIRVRLIAGAGEDVLADSSAGRARVAFHAVPGEENRVLTRRATAVDTVPFVPPAEEDPVSGATYRDFGSLRRATPLLSYGSTLGLVAGGAVTWTRFGFRRVPHAREIELGAAYSFRLDGVAVELEADVRRPSSIAGRSLLLRATQLEPFYFFGFGNDAPEPERDDLYLVERDLLIARPALDFHFAPGSRISVGPVLKYSRLRPREGSLAQMPQHAGDGLGQLGGRAEAVLDLRDRPALPRGGVFASFGGSAYAAAWDADEPFGSLRSAVSTYLSVPGPRGPTLALRAGAAQVWGDFPVHEAAFLGGWETVRGYQDERFAGDAALWGTAELRSFLTRANLLIRGDLGGLVFADAGRVYLRGESPGGWHRGIGGGLYFLFDINGLPISSTALYARGETDRFRVQLGVPF